MSDVELVKGFLIKLITEKRGAFDSGEWEADYKLNWNVEFSERMNKAFSDVAKATAALEDKDEVMLCAAVINARMSFMDLAGFFRDIFDDFDVLARETPWPEVPENFDYEQKEKGR